MRYLLSLVFLTTLFYHSNAQEYKKYISLSYAELDSLMEIAYQKGDMPACIPYMQAGQEKAKAEFGEKDSIFAKYTGDLGFFYKQIGKYDMALSLYIQAKDILEKVLGREHHYFVTSLANIANLYQVMGDYEKALPLSIQAKDLWEKLLGEEHPYFASSLNNLAALHKMMGDYEKALPLYSQAKDIQEKVLGSEHPYFANSLNNLAGLYQAMGNYEKALPLLMQAKDIREKVSGRKHPLFASSLNNLAKLHYSMGNYEKALPLYTQSKDIYKEVLGSSHPDFAISLNNLATLHQAMGNYEKALPLLIQAKNIWEKALSREHPTFAQSLNNLASLHQITGNYEKAWNTLDSAMYSQSTILTERAFDENWLRQLQNAPYASTAHIRAVLASLGIVYTLLEKDSSQVGVKNKQAIVADLATALLSRTRNQVSDDQDKLRTLAQSNAWLLRSLAVLKPEEDKNTAFDRADQNKSVLLLQASKSEANYRLGELPDSLARQDKKQLKKRSQLQAKLLGKIPDSEKDSLRNELNRVNQDIDNFVSLIKKDYPKYHKLKYQQIAVKVEDIQKLIDDKTALLEYVISDSILHLFVIEKERVEWHQIPLSAKLLKTKIEQFHKVLSAYEKIKEESQANDYVQFAYWFYEKILEKALKDNKQIENLIIIPDGELAHLPFESFLTQKPDGKITFNKLPYLLREYNISYNYSASLWKENKSNKKQKNNGEIFALAANYQNKADSTTLRGRLPSLRSLRDALSPLPAARQEVEQLSLNYKGYFGFDSLASERNLMEKVGTYAIVHLAMHGILDEKRPILSSLALTEDGDSLYDNFWKAHEISKMELNADLVVLSACETGYGRFETGNGTASLARSFMYAGVPALVVSLWQVNDQSTSQIMQAFYANLAKGQDKAEALRQAKLSYIENAENDLAAHPAFWSPFILMGDESPIQLQPRATYSWLWWALGAVIGCIIIIGIIALKRQPTNRV